jgi:hypothetical protein
VLAVLLGVAILVQYLVLVALRVHRCALRCGSLFKRLFVGHPREDGYCVGNTVADFWGVS